MKIPCLLPLMLASLWTLYPRQTTATECEVRISAEIPEDLPLASLYLDTYEGRKAVTDRQLDVCVSRKELGQNPMKFAQNRVYLMQNEADTLRAIFSSYSHPQATHLHLDSITTLASRACPTLCGYYEFERLKQDPKLLALLGQPETEAKARQLSVLGENAWPALPALAPLPMTDHFVDYSSGAWRYFQPYTDLKGSFRQTFDAAKQPLFDGPDGSALSKLLKPRRREFSGVFNSDVPWPQYSEQLQAFAETLQKDPQLQPVARVINDSIKVVNDGYQSVLSNQSAPFSVLQSRELDFAPLLAHWQRFAYHSVNNPDTFQALFSSRFKRDDMPRLLSDRHLDRSLSRLLARSNRAAFNDPDKAFRHLLAEYQGQGKLEGNVFHFEDALEQISFVYEAGAWRLDRIQMNFSG